MPNVFDDVGVIPIGRERRKGKKCGRGIKTGVPLMCGVIM